MLLGPDSKCSHKLTSLVWINNTRDHWNSTYWWKLITIVCQMLPHWTKKCLILLVIERLMISFTRQLRKCAPAGTEAWTCFSSSGFILLCSFNILTFGYIIESEVNPFPWHFSLWFTCFSTTLCIGMIPWPLLDVYLTISPWFDSVTTKHIMHCECGVPRHWKFLFPFYWFFPHFHCFFSYHFYLPIPFFTMFHNRPAVSHGRPYWHA